MAVPGRRVEVSFVAMFQRLQRHLKKEHQMIRSPRGRAERDGLGDYYILDTYQNSVVDHKLTPKRIEEMARQRGVLAEWEEVR
jgi:hypothetical protein